jgi:hypothetical protein
LIIYFFNVRVTLLMESGIYNYWLVRWELINQKSEKQDHWMENYDFIVLELNRIKGVFYLYVIGLHISILYHIFEIYLRLYTEN